LIHKNRPAFSNRPVCYIFRPVLAVAKEAVTEMLRMALPTEAREVLELRKLAGKSSNAKLGAMLAYAGADNRVRGTLQYHGAHTARWGGRGPQPQNLPRPSMPGVSKKQLPAAIEKAFNFISHDEIGGLRAMGSLLDIISSCLRGMIVAPHGHEFYGADFAGIEARVLAWLAGDSTTVEAFRLYDQDKGPEVYKVAASGIYNKTVADITDKERTIGKVATLALGYQGGVGAFQNMAAVYGVSVSDQRADEIKIAWRQSHPEIVSYWGRLEKAAFEAITKPHTPVTVGPDWRRVEFLRSNKKGINYLQARLPSGRVMFYANPEIRFEDCKHGSQRKIFYKLTEDGRTSNISTYGGKLSENITQAVARDLLAEAMVRVDIAGFKTVLHVHDEIVAEVAKGAKVSGQFEQLMAEVPAWAEGLPIAVEGWTGRRFQK
jgi:DNA polymerase bacteriophage-type